MKIQGKSVSDERRGKLHQEDREKKKRILLKAVMNSIGKAREKSRTRLLRSYSGLLSTSSSPGSQIESLHTSFRPIPSLL